MSHGRILCTIVTKFSGFMGSFAHTHTLFSDLLSGTARVGQYQKKHSPTHTHPDHQTSFINFLHLLRSIASSLFSLHNLCPGPLWSSSWSWTLYFVLHAFLHPVIIIFLQHIPIPSHPVLLLVIIIIMQRLTRHVSVIRMTNRSNTNAMSSIPILSQLYVEICLLV